MNRRELNKVAANKLAGPGVAGGAKITDGFKPKKGVTEQYKELGLGAFINPAPDPFKR